MHVLGLYWVACMPTCFGDALPSQHCVGRAGQAFRLSMYRKPAAPPQLTRLPAACYLFVHFRWGVPSMAVKTAARRRLACARWAGYWQGFDGTVNRPLI